MGRKEAKRVGINRIFQPGGNSDERKLMECHNCGFKGHPKAKCRKPLVECQHCKRKGHLIQYCYGKRAQQRGSSTSGTSKLTAVTLATIVTFLVLGISGVRGEMEEVERYQSEPNIITDIFKVANHLVGCQIVRYIPMVGDGLFFYPTKGTEKISFVAEKDSYIECKCDYKKEGFVNPHTSDCYIPSNTSVTFNGDGAHDPRDYHWPAWNTYVFTRIKANHIPSHIQTTPFAHLKHLLKKGLTDEEMRRRKVEHIAKYEEMKKFVDAGPEQTAIRLEEDLEELQSEIDLAIQEHRKGEDPFEFYSTFTKSTEDQDFEDSSETLVSGRSTRYESVAFMSMSSGETDMNSRKTLSVLSPNIAPQVRTPIIDPTVPTLPSGSASIGNYPLRTTDLSKELKSEGLRKSLANLIERSKENDVRGVIDALINSFKIAEGMDSVGVLAICLSVILEVYYKQRVVNTIIQPVLNRIRGRTTQRDSKTRSRVKGESTEQRPITRKGTKQAYQTGSKKKGFYDLCDTDKLPFVENEEKLREAATRAGYTLMARISSLDVYKHTSTIIMNINETWLQVFIDDGSDVSLMSEKRWIQLGRPYLESTTAWIDNTHSSVGFLGVTELGVSARKLKQIKERFYVTQGLILGVIIGRTFLSKYPRYVHNYSKEKKNFINTGTPTLRTIPVEGKKML
uniref:CCHC-type domain-containing protein n=1 Tax=Strongyloides venezuelensis TaxID=75913 RepID=A0A0K0EVV9_STRVS